LPVPETTSAPRLFHVLVVEDEFLIAIELARILKDGGFEVVGPVSTVGAALHRIQLRRPDAAVLDVSLRRGERVTRVAEVLLSMGVPFVLASAYVPADLAAEPALSTARNLGKPTPPAALLATMREYRELTAG
jgi:DNA-binding NarL/FixJ family response regulator